MKKIERLEQLENKILYRYFRDTQKDFLLCEFASDYLNKKELKEYDKLRGEV